ncbi:hypothetical protein DAZ36_25185 [Salmonella enterica subsp. enterica serovar Enteritidis]|nr:hypothetical protein [Salmonella enterica subsp. enterica serovar Enteritidis]
MSFEIKGLRELQKKLDDLANNTKALDGQHQVPLTDLLNPAFIASCSKFSSVEELFDASGFKIESAEDLKAIPDAEWDSFIKSNTTYESWLEMQKSAAVLWAKGKLGL